MTRTRQIPRDEVDDSVRPVYERIFGDRDPVAEPGTATGTPGNWWTVFAQTPELTASVFNDAERAVLAYTDEVVLADGRVHDATFAALAAHLDEPQILELTYAVTTYKLHATLCRALRLEYDDVDERIVEIAAPVGDSEDVMGTISMRD